MKFRIKEYLKGLVVEIQKTTWYGKKYWTHFISVAGIESMPWYHGSYEFAMTSLLSEIRVETNRNSRA